MSDDLLIRAREIQGPLLVLSHPGSGTQWTCWGLRRTGKRGVQHEQISPSQQDPPWPGEVVVSYRYRPGDRVEVHKPQRTEREIGLGWPVWQLVRDPMRTVFSAGAVAEQSPKSLLRIVEVTIPDEEERSRALRSEPLVTMLVSVVRHLERASALASATFRVEDIAPPAKLDERHRNTHVRTLPRWERLFDAARLSGAENEFEALRGWARQYGYPDHDSAPAPAHFDDDLHGQSPRARAEEQGGAWPRGAP